MNSILMKIEQNIAEKRITSAEETLNSVKNDFK